MSGEEIISLTALIGVKAVPKYYTAQDNRTNRGDGETKEYQTKG